MPVAPQRKLFEIPGLNGTVSYFGLADANHKETFEDLLASFLSSHGTLTLKQFSHSLTAELAARVDKTWLADGPSGLHICGFTAQSLPEFWFIRNIQGMNGYSYSGFCSTYTITEELRGQHQSANFDPQGGDFIRAFGMNFANGDIRPFHHAWNLFDGFADQMETEGVSEKAVTHVEHKRRAEWKLRTIAGFYETIATDKLIGEPITTILLTP